MPRRKDVNKVLVIGSGPIVIGQAAEFDYAGTQACRALREEGIEVVLVNSNPATIMTDTNMADRIYIEPLDAETLKGSSQGKDLTACFRHWEARPASTLPWNLQNQVSWTKWE